MVVYVDNMHSLPMGRYRGMKMSHLIADTEEELHAMAKLIGLKRKWFQKNHYDVSLGLRKWAVAHGAIEIDIRTCAVMVGNQRAGYPMGTPKTCIAISKRRVKAAMIARELIGKETGR